MALRYNRPTWYWEWITNVWTDDFCEEPNLWWRRKQTKGRRFPGDGRRSTPGKTFGCHPPPFKRMLRIYLLPRGFGCIDMGMEEVFHAMHLPSRFVGIDHHVAQSPGTRTDESGVDC